MATREAERLENLFACEKDVKFWKKKKAKFDNLFWVRAMTSNEPVFEAAHPSGVEGVTLTSQDKARLYGHLAEALSEPTISLAENLISSGKDEDLFAPLPAHPFFKAIQSSDVSLLVDSLKVEYTRIFIDSYLPFIPPYESIYLGERQVMGKAAGRVTDHYKRFGVGAVGEMPDHIAHECEFVALLYNQGELELAERFLSEHLLGWGPKFCADLKLLGKGGFYEAVALAAESLFFLEAQQVSS